jgi:acetyl-CoA/propionyl-CoA carboxylase biotin carboxyl carrier protein
LSGHNFGTNRLKRPKAVVGVRVGNSRKINKVLIANRGEIAIRVARACADSGIASVAVYADPDRDAQHVKAADEAFALGGNTAAESYLVIEKLIEAAKKSGSNAVHPGYGFLSENAEFAQAVIDAGLIWIGPPPQAIRDLGDKVSARHIAARAGAPQVQGTPDPVKDSKEVVEFAKQYGLPIAIKAAFGGGGRGLKVARNLEEIPELFESAVREAVAAFGRGECFVERYLDNPRHVETQCLADEHGNVVIVSTRDCSLQRRHQKLVEEAPAPFLSQAQIDELYNSSKAIMKEAKYVGAGTCEFLIGLDGTISFLEVNTRLQVEHPVSEEVAGIDLVREQFRIAQGEALGYEDPELRGHSIEFRINGEDPGRGFLPAPGSLTVWNPPSGPGVRLDSGFTKGDVIGGNFDSLLAKLIVTGRDRQEALERSRRALAEFEIDGIATALTFHRAVVSDPAFAPTDATTPFSVHTRWIETEFNNTIPAFSGGAGELAEPETRNPITVEVNGRRIEVVLPGDMSIGSGGGAKKSARKIGKKSGAVGSGDAVVAPMQGTIVKIAVTEGQEVAQGDLVVVLEAMKMEQPLTAHKSGIVTGLTAEVGTTVPTGTELMEIK